MPRSFTWGNVLFVLKYSCFIDNSITLKLNGRHVVTFHTILKNLLYGLNTCAILHVDMACIFSQYIWTVRCNWAIVDLNLQSFAHDCCCFATVLWRSSLINWVSIFSNGSFRAKYFRKLFWANTAFHARETSVLLIARTTNMHFQHLSTERVVDWWNFTTYQLVDISWRWIVVQ